MDWDRNHLVMRHVDLAKVVIDDALRIRSLAAGRPLVEAMGGPLVYAWRNRTGRRSSSGSTCSRPISRSAWPSP